MIKWVKKQLTGTGEELKDGLLYENNPFDRYVTGILYPISEPLDDLEDMDFEDDGDEASKIKTTTQYQPPSSMGFSLYTKMGEKKPWRYRWSRNSI